MPNINKRKYVPSVHKYALINLHNISHCHRRDLMERFLEPDPSSDEDAKATITTATDRDPGLQKKKRKVTGGGEGGAGGRRKAIAWTEGMMSSAIIGRLPC